MRLVVVSVLAAVATASACAISESGLLPDDAGSLDGGGNDVAILPCTTLDAACLGALDPIWKPVATTDASCAAGWTSVHLQTNPHDIPGSCACGACSVVGSYACTTGVPISGGNNCGDSPFATATPGQCTNVTATQHLQAHGTNATGSVSCSAPGDAGTGAASDDLALCVPGCDSDFCGGGSRCIVAEGDVACPNGFLLFTHAGTGVDPGCGPCPCEAGAPGACSGTVTAFFNDNCQAQDDAGTFGIETCNYISQQYKSVWVDLTPPDASCTVTGSPDGDASLLGEKTICCQ